MALKERMRMIQRNGESELKQKLLTLASRDNDIKTNVVESDSPYHYQTIRVRSE